MHEGEFSSHNFSQQSVQQQPRLQTTLLNLVWTVSHVTETDQQTVALVAALINSGRVQLTGTFKNAGRISV
jgi:hypothetical protein